MIKTGSRVRVRTAESVWISGRAMSGVETTHVDGLKIHDFPVVHVIPEGGDGTSIPWPVEDVEEDE